MPTFCHPYRAQFCTYAGGGPRLDRGRSRIVRPGRTSCPMFTSSSGSRSLEFFLFLLRCRQSAWPLQGGGAGNDRKRDVRALLPGADEYARAARHVRALDSAVRAVLQSLYRGGAGRGLPDRSARLFSSYVKDPKTRELGYGLSALPIVDPHCSGAIFGADPRGGPDL